MSNFLQQKGIWLPIKIFLILIIIALSALTLVGSYLLRNIYNSIAMTNLQYSQNQTEQMLNDQVSE